jgi:hypothetical protein
MNTALKTGEIFENEILNIIHNYVYDSHPVILKNIYSEGEVKNINNIKNKITKYINDKKIIPIKKKINIDAAAKNLKRTLQKIYGDDIIEFLNKKIKNKEIIKQMNTNGKYSISRINYINGFKEISNVMRNNSNIDKYIKDNIKDYFENNKYNDIRPYKLYQYNKQQLQKPIEDVIEESVGEESVGEESIRRLSLSSTISTAKNENLITEDQAEEIRKGNKSLLDYIDKDKLKKISMLSTIILGVPIGLYSIDKLIGLFKENKMNITISNLNQIISDIKKQDKIDIDRIIKSDQNKRQIFNQLQANVVLNDRNIKKQRKTKKNTIKKKKTTRKKK